VGLLTVPVVLEAAPTKFTVVPAVTARSQLGSTMWTFGPEVFSKGAPQPVTSTVLLKAWISPAVPGKFG